MTKLQNAYNEFIADFCERHGECQATRDEAHEIADKLTALGSAIATSVLAYDGGYTMVEDMIYASALNEDEAYLASKSAHETFNA